MPPLITVLPRRLAAAISDVGAFAIAAVLFFGISSLKKRLLTAPPFGLAPSAAPYIAYAAGFAVLGGWVGWRAVQLERAQSARAVNVRLLFATCVIGCTLVGLVGAWLLG